MKHLEEAREIAMFRKNAIEEVIDRYEKFDVKTDYLYAQRAIEVEFVDQVTSYLTEIDQLVSPLVETLK